MKRPRPPTFFPIQLRARRLRRFFPVRRSRSRVTSQLDRSLPPSPLHPPLLLCPSVLLSSLSLHFPFMTLSFSCAMCLGERNDLVYGNGCMEQAQHYVCVACAVEYTSYRVKEFQDGVQQADSLETAPIFQCMCPVCRLPSDAWLPLVWKERRTAPTPLLLACNGVNQAIIRDVMAMLLDRLHLMPTRDAPTCRTVWASMAHAYPRLDKFLSVDTPNTHAFFRTMGEHADMIVAAAAPTRLGAFNAATSSLVQRVNALFSS
jgi:hypothetical protein